RAAAARHGRTSAHTFRTSPSRLRKTTSMGNRIKKVCTEGAGRINIPSPRGSSRRPSSPRIRRNIVSATTQRLQTTAPSDSRSRVTLPFANVAEVRSVTARLATGSTATAERPEEEEQGRAEQDDEHCREDQEHQREEDLYRRLLCAFLRVGPPPPSHLLRKVAHDLPDRH